MEINIYLLIAFLFSLLIIDRHRQNGTARLMGSLTFIQHPPFCVKTHRREFITEFSICIFELERYILHLKIYGKLPLGQSASRQNGNSSKSYIFFAGGVL